MNARPEKLHQNLPVPAAKRDTEIIVKPKLPPAFAEFQSDAVELEERVPPRIARMTLYGITALIGTAIVWASLSKIDEVVIAPGKRITTRPTIIVQPLETSIHPHDRRDHGRDRQGRADIGNA